MDTEKSYITLFMNLKKEFHNAAAKLSLKRRLQRANPRARRQRRSWAKYVKQLSPLARAAVEEAGKRGKLEEKLSAIRPTVVRATRLVLAAISENKVILGPIADAAKFLPQRPDDDALVRFWNEHVVPELSKDSPAAFAKLPAAPAAHIRRCAMACRCLAAACWSQDWVPARWYTANTGVTANDLRQAAGKSQIPSKKVREETLYPKSRVKKKWPFKWGDVK
jgi:hypothetical protein